MQFVELNKLVTHYRWSDKGRDKPVLVFSNAVATDLRTWDAVSEALGDSVSILAYDKRGHGLSDLGTPPYRIDDYVGDLAGLLDHLKIGKAVICGLSIGGQIAQGLALARPELVTGLILCCTASRIGTPEQWTERIRIVKEGGLAAVADASMARWFTPAFRHPDNPLLAGARTMLVRQDLQGYMGACAALRDADFTDAVGKISVPTLCVAGDGDVAIPPDAVQALARRIPNSEFTVIENCSHLPCLEQPARLAELITAFIAKGRAHG